MFLDEARLAARIQHPNVVSTLDVVATGGELFLVMEFIQGETLARLWRASRAAGRSIDPRITATVMSNALQGLHAAHEAKDERGKNLGIVHRDVSPQNVMVGIDGTARVLDFGVAKALGRLQTTREGQVKGKLAYMAMEQIDASNPVTRQVDVYAAGVVCWEMLTGKRLYEGDTDTVVFARVMKGDPPAVSSINPEVSADIDGIVRRALARDPGERYDTARAFALELERALGIASAFEVGEWVRSCAGGVIDARAARILEMESSSSMNLSLRDDLLVRKMLDGPHLAERADLEPTLQDATDGGAAGAEADPSGRRTKLSSVILIAGVVALVLLLSSVLLLRRTADPTVEPTSTSSNSLAATGVASSPDTALAEASAKVPPVASTPVSEPPADAASAVATVKPTSTKGTTPRPSTTRTSTPPPGDCDPPYSINAQGHKTWKKHCLR
jgi:serine/threonine-protein kinase